jgi:hypothetical protein
VNLRQVAVEDHHVIRVHQSLLDRCGPVIGHVGGHALVVKTVRDVVRQLGLILDHQHPHKAMMPCRTSHWNHKRSSCCLGRLERCLGFHVTDGTGSGRRTVPRVMPVLRRPAYSYGLTGRGARP